MRKQHKAGTQYNMRIALDEYEHKLLKDKQEQRRLHGLPFLSLDKLAKVFMLEGLLQRHFEEHKP